MIDPYFLVIFILSVAIFISVLRFVFAEEIYTKTKIPLSISKKIIDLSKGFKK